MRIAWFTPFSPASAIGHYSEIVTGLLADRSEVVVYASEQGKSEPRSCRLPVVRLPLLPNDGFLEELESFDLLVYNMGDNAPFHSAIYNVAQRRPGIVILHDLVLRDFFYMHYQCDPVHFADFLTYAHGDEAAEQVQALREDVHEERPEDPRRLDLPLFRPALHRTLGVVVHSEYAARRIRPVCPAPLATIDFPFPVPAETFHRRVGGKVGRVKLLTFGVLNSNKLIHATLRAIANSPLLRSTVEFIVVGDGPSDYVGELKQLVTSEGLGECVRLEGYQPDAVLAEHLRQADVVVNLRNPHLGESSWSLLEALGAGAATVVWGHGFYDEFPEDVICKVRNEAELRPALERLVLQPGERSAMGRRACDHVRTRFHPDRYLDRFLEFADTARSYRPILSLVDTVSDVLLEMGSGSMDSLSEDMQTLIASLLPAGEQPGASMRPPAQAA